MLTGLWFVLLFGTVSSVRCPRLDPPIHGTVMCVWRNVKVRCGRDTPIGSIAGFTCQEFYKLEGRRFIKCRSDGRWSFPTPACNPDCGKRSQAVGLIVNGFVVPRGAFPWHVAIYHLTDVYEYWCGGTLVSNRAVITAAHCTWQIPPERLMLVFGKHHREYNQQEEGTQKRRVQRIEILDSYQDVVGNYNGDIAVVVMEEPIILGHYSAPVCIDWDQHLSDRHLLEGSKGVVLGWGLTEDDTFSDNLRMVSLPVVSARRCIAEQEEDFKKFITSTSFCAGWRTGAGVCNGDSGGGLVFFDEFSGRWFIQGLVSVSPRRKGTSHCNPNMYTVFTKLNMFIKWLKTIGI